MEKRIKSCGCNSHGKCSDHMYEFEKNFYIKCDGCGDICQPDEIIHGPNPFTEEIYGVIRIEDLCKDCYKESCLAI